MSPYAKLTEADPRAQVLERPDGRRSSMSGHTSFPGNPAHGLPTVTGIVVLSDASNGMPRALLDAAAVTALRTGAAAVLAAETLARADASRPHVTAAEIGARVASSREEALRADVVATVTPGKEVVVAEGGLRPGQHVSLMGADGSGKAEIAVGEFARVYVF